MHAIDRAEQGLIPELGSVKQYSHGLEYVKVMVEKETDAIIRKYSDMKEDYWVKFMPPFRVYQLSLPQIEDENEHPDSVAKKRPASQLL